MRRRRKTPAAAQQQSRILVLDDRGTGDLAAEFIETKAVPAAVERVHAAMLEEFGLEDRINDEVRVILEAYSEEMRKSGANYQEMFRKVKSELTRKYKAVL